MKYRIRVMKDTSTLERLGGDPLRSALSEQINEDAGDVVDYAKGIVPVDTGVLKGSIKVKRPASPARLSAVMGPDKVRYAGFVEYGTYKMAARPYMGNTMAWIEPRFRQHVEDVIRRVAGTP